MKNNFRIGIAVATVAALGCGVAQAATLANGPGGAHTYSLQGQTLSPVTAAQPLPNTVVTLGADYSVNDNITVRVAGATLGGATNANLGNVNAIICEQAGVLPDANPANDPILVSFITRTGNDILLRVTQKNVINTTGDVCYIGNPFVVEPIQATQASLSTLTTVTMNWLATTAITNIPFDPANTLTIASVIDQFVTTPFQVLNGIVDVNDPSLRRSFTTSDFGIWGTDDAFIVDTLDRAAAITAGPVATLNTVFATLIGDVSFIDNDNDGCETTDLTSGAGRVNPFENGGGAGVAGVATNCGQVTWTYTPGGAGENVRHWLIPGNDRTVAGARVLTAPQQFTATVRYTYSLGAATASRTDGPVSAGEWRLNGFSAFVPYMPYGPTISQIIYLTNKSGQSGTITVDAYNQAGTACNFSAGTMQAGRVTVLSGLIKTGLEGCYGANFDDRVSMTVVANIPAGRAELVTAYNVNGNRVQVANSSNGRIVQGGNSTTGGQL